MVKYLISILFFLLASGMTSAQDVSFTASAPKVVSQGEQFRLVYSLNAKADQFTPSNMSPFQVLIGPSSSYNSSTSIVNGKMTQKVTYSYTYILQAIDEGKFEIPPAAVQIGNKSFESNSVQIEVVKGTPPSSPQTNPSAATANVQNLSDDDLFVRVSLNKSEVYLGEHIIATVKIYSRVNLSGFEEVKFPSFSGFLKEDIETPALRSLERENVNGEIYGTGVLSQVVLFPQKTGEIIIDPVEITALIQQRVTRNQRNFFDDFFDSFQTIRREIKSPQLRLNVKPLPPGSPQGFTGAVGDFKMQASVDKNEANTNEAVTLKVEISGNGNLKLISPPPVDFPLDFESYDPKTSSNLKASITGVSGYKNFEYLLIPRFAGDYRIPELVFSYFDPRTKQYKSLRSNGYQVKVNKSESDQNTTFISSPSQEDVQFIGQDIRFIYSGDMTLRAIGVTLFGSIWFILLYLFSLIVFLMIFLFRRKKIKEQSNKELLKNRKANKYARKRLKDASIELKEEQSEAFYKAILKALWGYLSDKLGIPVSVLSRENIASNLRIYKLDDELISALLELVDQCEFAQYAPSASSSELNEIYRNTVKMITKLEQKLK